MKQKLKTGAEYDWCGSWRKVYCYTGRPGVGKSIKRGMNKRFRKDQTEINEFLRAGN